MKKSLLVLLVLCPILSYAQIETSKIRIAPNTIDSKKKEPYDSTKNMPTISDYETYVGQLIYKDGNYYIIDKIEKSNYIYGTAYTYRITYRNRDIENEILWGDVELNGAQNPWLTVSYYNYLRTLIGQKFYLSDEAFRVFDDKSNFGYCLSPYDIKTGKTIDFQPFDLWEFIEIAEKEGDRSLIAIFRNNKGEVSYCDLFQFGKTKKGTYNLLPQKEYNRLAKKYGMHYTQLMLKNDYERGMPKELFRLVWGTPDKVNTSTYSEQWIYEGLENDYFYFSNEKLSGWN